MTSVMTAAEHARIVLSAILPERGDLLDRALAHLTPGHFTDRTLANLFVMLERYADLTGGVLTRGAVVDNLHRAGADAGKIALYAETWDALAAASASDADFRWSLEQLRELAADRATGAALTESMRILTQGAETPDGSIARGHAEARLHVLQRFAEIDRDLSMQDAPEGDLGAEGDEILADYAHGEAARAAGRSPGIMFGLPPLDAKTDGVHAGDLVLVVGFTNEGKSHIAVQLAWHAAVMQGKNVVFLTTETVRETVRRRMICRHSCLERFAIPDGLNSRDLKNYSLSAQGKQQLRAVVHDSSTNPSYGRRYIAQVPQRATLGHIESKLVRLQRMFPIDLVILDSLYLLRPDKRRSTDREELSGILKEAKQLTTTFNDGRGVPIVSPWQVSRAARDLAERTGAYNNSALSETAEAANSPDLIISLLAPVDCDDRHARLRMQVMKNRDGERANPFEIAVDYATSRFSAAPAGGGVTALTSLDDMWAADDLLDGHPHG